MAPPAITSTIDVPAGHEGKPGRGTSGRVAPGAAPVQAGKQEIVLDDRFDPVQTGVE
jgi:hypothetical protein